MLPLQNTVVMQWIIFGLSVAATVGSVVAQFLGAGNYTPAAIASGIVAILLAILTQVTKSDQAKAIAEMKRISGKK